MNLKQAYVNGFVKRATEYGYSVKEAFDLLGSTPQHLIPRDGQLPRFNPGLMQTNRFFYGSDADAADVIGRKLPGYEMFGRKRTPMEDRLRNVLPPVLGPGATMDQVKNTPGMKPYIAGSSENTRMLREGLENAAHQKFPNQINLNNPAPQPE